MASSHPFADRLSAYIGPCFLFGKDREFASTRVGRAAAALLLAVIAKEAVPITVVLDEAAMLMRSWSWESAHIATQIERMCDLRNYGFEEIRLQAAGQTKCQAGGAGKGEVLG